MIYLDNAATSFPKPEIVYQRVDYVQRTLAVNVGRGSYKVANDAMKIVDETRYLMAKLVGVDNSNNVVLTPSATIAANEIIYGLEWSQFKNVYVTPFEHNAIARPLQIIKEQYGVKIIQLILKGCYPLHPITVWLLSNMNNWMQQRSAITFAAEMIERISNDVIEETWLPYDYFLLGTL